MPRDALAITEIAAGGPTTEPAGTAITPANGVSIADVQDTQRLVLRLTNTAGAAKNVTVKAGDNPPSSRAALGDRVFSVAAGATVSFQIESARHAQNDGSAEIDFEAGMTGTIRAFRTVKGGV